MLGNAILQNKIENNVQSSLHFDKLTLFYLSKFCSCKHKKHLCIILKALYNKAIKSLSFKLIFVKENLQNNLLFTTCRKSFEIDICTYIHTYIRTVDKNKITKRKTCCYFRMLSAYS